MLTVVSVWFMLTADEKHLLRTGLANPVRNCLTDQVVKAVHDRSIRAELVLVLNQFCYACQTPS